MSAGFDRPRPKVVAVRLRDLVIGEEFWTSLTRRQGVVTDWGHVRDVEPRTGAKTRVRAVRVRFGFVERVFSAEMIVLVPFDRAHARHDPKFDAQRWRLPLDGGSETNLATFADVARMGGAA